MAFEDVYRQYYDLSRAVAIGILGEVTAAEDVSQSVFLTLWNAPGAFRGGNIAGWLVRATRNRALDLLRRRAARPEFQMRTEDCASLRFDDAVIFQLEGERVRLAVARLPARERILIEIGFFGGVSHKEIARRTLIPLGTVKTRMRSGLRRLRSMLETTL